MQKSVHLKGHKTKTIFSSLDPANKTIIQVLAGAGYIYLAK